MSNLAALYAYRTTPADPAAKQHRDDLAAALNPNVRHCPCGSPIQRRADEAWNRYLRRETCSRSCAGTIRAKAAAATRRAQRIEDLHWIAGTCSTEDVAARLGYSSVDTMLDTLSRWGEHELLATLRRHRAEKVA